MASDNPSKNYQNSIMGKKVPQLGGNSPNTQKPPAIQGGNTPNATKPPRSSTIGGNYAGPGHKIP